MPDNRTNILDILAMMGAIVFLAWGAVNAVMRGSSIGFLLLGMLALFVTWLLIRDLRKGVRPPTRWEWFKAWMTMRPVLIGALGFAFFMSLLSIDRASVTLSNDSLGIGLTGIALLWALSIFYTVWRAPHRRESDTTYKKRIGYTDTRESL